MCIRQRIGGSNPPLTAIFEMRACTQVRALFFIFSAGGMRTPDRGSTTGNASWTDRKPASGLPRRGERSESIPPHRHIRDESLYASTGSFLYILRRGDENPRPGFDNWQRQLDRPQACERAAPQGRAKRVNPPLTAIFEMRACTQVRALFFIFSAGGMRTPDRGFDNWQRQLDRPQACERAAPQGRAKRVNPPLTAIF